MTIMRCIHIAVLIAIALVTACGGEQSRTNTYVLDISGPPEADRLRLRLNGNELVTLAGSQGSQTVSLDEPTPFPMTKVPGALKADMFGPDGWIAADAHVEEYAPEWIKEKLAKGESLPLKIRIGFPSQAPLHVYVDNRDRAQATVLSLGQAERRVEAETAMHLLFLNPKTEAGTRLGADGVEIGRVRRQKAEEPEDNDRSCWLVDVSGQHAYRLHVVAYRQSADLQALPVPKDKETLLKPAHLHEIPYRQINFFLTSAPLMIRSPNAGERRVELMDIKKAVPQ